MGRHSRDEPGFPAGGKSGRGAGHPDGWNPNRDDSQPDGRPLPDGVEGHPVGDPDRGTQK
jgi:hypothetical protein